MDDGVIGDQGKSVLDAPGLLDAGRWEGLSRSQRRRKRRKLVGDLAAHARFLQYVFRRTTCIRPGCWRRGGLVGVAWLRRRETFACGGGRKLAAESDFEEQEALARQALSWYRNYVRLLHCSNPWQQVLQITIGASYQFITPMY